MVYYGVSGMVISLVLIATYFIYGESWGISSIFILIFFLFYVFCCAVSICAVYGTEHCWRGRSIANIVDEMEYLYKQRCHPRIQRYHHTLPAPRQTTPNKTIPATSSWNTSKANPLNPI